MLRFTREQRQLLAETLKEVANIAAGGLVGLMILLGGITFFAVLVTVLDGISYRRERASHGKKP